MKTTKFTDEEMGELYCNATILDQIKESEPNTPRATVLGEHLEWIVPFAYQLKILTGLVTDEFIKGSSLELIRDTLINYAMAKAVERKDPTTLMPQTVPPRNELTATPNPFIDSIRAKVADETSWFNSHGSSAGVLPSLAPENMLPSIAPENITRNDLGKKAGKIAKVTSPSHQYENVRAGNKPLLTVLKEASSPLFADEGLDGMYSGAIGIVDIGDDINTEYALKKRVLLKCTVSELKAEIVKQLVGKIPAEITLMKEGDNTPMVENCLVDDYLVSSCSSPAIVTYYYR